MKKYNSVTKKWKIEIPILGIMELLNELNLEITPSLNPNLANAKNLSEYHKEATLIELRKKVIKAITTQKNYLILFRYEAITLSEFECDAKYYLTQIT